ncbi:UNVERIFIED_CONTAM: hypothetical protein GTU68_030553 [Idotea baltica]|nr:hypothetical protein [Idotea baltica]
MAILIMRAQLRRCQSERDARLSGRIKMTNGCSTKLKRRAPSMALRTEKT